MEDLVASGRDPTVAADAEARGVLARPFLTNNAIPVRPIPLRDLFPRANPSEISILKRVKDSFVNGATHTAPGLNEFQSGLKVCVCVLCCVVLCCVVCVLCCVVLCCCVVLGRRGLGWVGGIERISVARRAGLVIQDSKLTCTHPPTSTSTRRQAFLRYVGFKKRKGESVSLSTAEPHAGFGQSWQEGFVTERMYV